MNEKTLLVTRALKNTNDFTRWAAKQGFKNVIEAKDLHTTIAFSKGKVPWNRFDPIDDTIINTKSKRTVTPLGNEGAIVLKFNSKVLEARWKHFVDNGCSWDWDSYQPHITITWTKQNIDLSKVEPYDGELIFGPEIFKEINLQRKAKYK